MALLMSAARNLPLTASVVGLHVGRTGVKAASVMLRRSPQWVRTTMHASAVRRVRPDLAALALAADGKSLEARAVLTEAIGAQPPGPTSVGAPRLRACRTLAQAATVLHDLSLAERALGPLLQAPDGHQADAHPRGSTTRRSQDVAVQVTRALVAAEQGNLTDAIACVAAVPVRSAQKVHRQLVGQQEVLQADLLSCAPGRPVPRSRGPRGKVCAVLHAVSTALPEQQTGYTVRTQGIVAAQRAAGVDAHVTTRLGYPVDVGVFGAPLSVEHEGVPYHRLLPTRGIPAPSLARQRVAISELATLVQRLSPSVLHAHSKHENAQIAITVGRRLGVPVVYEARGFLEETWASSGGDSSSDFYRWSRQAETACMQQADRVVTLSSAMARDIVGRGIDAGRVHVVPNAVPSSFAQRASTADAELARRRVRHALRIPMSSAVFGTISTLNDYEGLDTAIAALALPQGRGHRLLIVGDGPARAGLAAVAAEAGVADRVTFVGRVRHHLVRDYLDAMDVFVVPRKETSVTRLVPPLKPFEAMAVGLPVLASDLPPLVEIVRPGRHGYVVSAQDPAAWAERMQVLAANPGHRRELGARAKKFVAQHRTWDQAAEHYDDVYQMALCGPLVRRPGRGTPGSADGQLPPPVQALVPA